MDAWIAWVETFVDLRFVVVGAVMALLGPLIARSPDIGMTHWLIRDGVPLGKRGRIYAATTFELCAATIIMAGTWPLWPLMVVPHVDTTTLDHVPPAPVFLLYRGSWTQSRPVLYLGLLVRMVHPTPPLACTRIHPHVRLR